MGKIYEQYGWFGVFCVIGIALCLIFGALCLDAWIAVILWDWIVINTFGWTTMELTFWQMLGLIMLCNILFKTPNFGKNKNDNNEETPRS